MFLRKKTISELTEECLRSYEAGDYEPAEKLAHKILKLDSSKSEVLMALGNIFFLRGEYAKALRLYQKTDSLKPDNYASLVNLANTYFELHNFEDAIKFAKKALKLDSSSILGYIILGNSSLELEHITEAVAALEQALELDSSDPWICNYLSQAYQKNQDFSKALSIGWRSVWLSDCHQNHAIGFGYLLYETALEKGADEVQKYASLWLEKFPENPIAKHMGNAIKNNSAISKADADYVKHIFDVFAADFEEVLASLDYSTPEHINRILSEIYSADSHLHLRILDAGCGTGLCGKFLKKYSGFFSLDGVDISPEMLKIAARKKVYNHLFCADLDSFFATEKKSYDLIVASDVLTYFGELDSLLQQMALSLKKNGRLIFSISEGKAGQADWILHASGRFLHHPDYIKKLAANNRLVIEKEEYSRLRTEGGDDVFGYIFSLKNA